MKYPRHLTAILVATAALGLVPLTVSAQLPNQAGGAPNGAATSVAETHAVDQAIMAVNTLSATDSINTADLEPGAIRPVAAGDAAATAATATSANAGTKGTTAANAATTKTCHRRKAQ